MGKQSSDYKQLSREELSEMAGEELPERAAMSLINANIAIPINAAVAANVLSDGAVAYANAAQQTPIHQSNLQEGPGPSPRTTNPRPPKRPTRPPARSCPRA